MLGHPGKDFENYQNREVHDHSYHIDIYTRHGHPEVMGSSGFSIDPLGNIDAQILKTFNNSLLVANKPWDMPKKLNGAYDMVFTVDPLISENMLLAHQKMQDEINNKIKTLTNVSVNSGELFTNLQIKYFETSWGLKGQKENSSIYFEIAIEKLPIPNTQEVLKYKKAISLEDARLSQFIDKAVEETLSIADAEMPKTSDNGIVLIDGEAISSLLTHVVNQLNAQREYEKSPYMSTGDSLLKGEKKPDSDKLSIFLDPTVPVMALTTPFTNEGMKPTKAEVVKKDMVTAQIIHHRMGQYLDKAPNYIEGNMLVELGRQSSTELIHSVDECIEIIAFSSLLIAPNTLTWSSEIKLGKLYKNGAFVCMIKGGVVSGNIRENLTNFSFSNEEVKINETGGGYGHAKGYVGPQHMLIKSGVKIVGE
jgi:predicted Zn-dependent protease